MKKFVLKITAAGALLVCFAYCTSTKNATTKDRSLKDAYKNDFLIGTALNTPQIEERDPNAAALIPFVIQSNGEGKVEGCVSI